MMRRNRLSVGERQSAPNRSKRMSARKRSCVSSFKPKKLLRRSAATSTVWPAGNAPRLKPSGRQAVHHHPPSVPADHSKASSIVAADDRSHWVRAYLPHTALRLKHSLDSFPSLMGKGATCQGATIARHHSALVK
eukprot:4733270-Amphidinium_carterae.1